MSDKKFRDLPVRPVNRHWICDCGGEMIRTGVTFPTNPYQYEHKCNKCDRKETATEMYPSVVFLDDFLPGWD